MVLGASQLKTKTTRFTNLQQEILLCQADSQRESRRLLHVDMLTHVDICDTYDTYHDLHLNS